MTVTHLFECPVCGHQKYANITVYGDYDGQDRPSELTNCEACVGIKMSSPALWERMKLLADRVKQEKASCDEKIKACKLGMVSPEKAARLLHSPFALDSFFSAYKKEFSELMKLGAGTSERWAHRHACRRMIWAYLRKTQEAEKISAATKALNSKERNKRKKLKQKS